MSKKSELIPVRLSHLLRHCSVGAIVRGPDYLMTVKDIREWTDRNGKPAGKLIRYVDGVRSALGITQELREPPIAKELDTGLVDGLWYLRNVSPLGCAALAAASCTTNHGKDCLQLQSLTVRNAPTSRSLSKHLGH